MPFYIYILYSETADKYYTGFSKDPWKRLMEHNSSQDATYTSKYRPWFLKAVFYVSEIENDAVKIERFLKKQKSRTLLENLINPHFQPVGRLAQLVRVPHVRD